MYNTNGLKDDEVKESRKRYGSNSINEKNKNTTWKIHNTGQYRHENHRK